MKSLLFSLLFLSAASLADQGGTSVTHLRVDEFNQLFNGLNEVKENTWENWGLTETEWQTYENIQEKTVWGSWENKATPLQLLAIYTSDIEEKRRYARIEAKLDQWREDAALTYQQIYNNEREIVHAKYAAFIKGRRPVIENVKPSDRIAYFTHATNCDARCKGMITRLVSSGAKIDVYVMDTDKQDEVFAWASDASIPIERVQTNQITLNFDEGTFNDVSSIPAAFASIPVAYIKSESGYVRLAL